MKKLLVVLALLITGQSFAENIKIVVPFAAGGSADFAARTVEQILSQKTSHNYVVEYHVGAGGQIGAKFVADKKNPGTVLLVHSASVILQGIGDNAVYNYKNFIPVANVGSIQWVVVTNKNSHINTPERLLTTKDVIFFGSSGVGTTNHIAGEILKYSTKQNLVHVPFKGESAAFIELLGNRISLLFASSGIVNGHSDVKVLAVTGTARSQEYPDAPTLSELGIKGFEVNPNWLVVLANPGANQTIVQQIQLALNEGLRDQTYTQSLANAGIGVEKNNILNTKKFLETEEEKLKKFVK